MPSEGARIRIALKLTIAVHGIVMLAEHGFLPPKIRKISLEELVDDLVKDAEKATKLEMKLSNDKLSK